MASDRDGSMSSALVLLALAMLLQLIVSFFGVGSSLSYVILLQTVCFLIPALFYLWRFPSNERVFSLRLLRRWFLVFSFVAGLALNGVVSILTAWLERWIPPFGYVLETRAFLLELFVAERPCEWISILFVGAVFVGFCEEVLFRGAIMAPFERRMSPGAANGIVATLFALVHLDPWSFPGIFALGLFFGRVRLRSGSCWPAVAAHAGANVGGIFLMNREIDLLDSGCMILLSSGLVFVFLYRIFLGRRPCPARLAS